MRRHMAQLSFVLALFGASAALVGCDALYGVQENAIDASRNVDRHLGLAPPPPPAYGGYPDEDRGYPPYPTYRSPAPY